MGYELDKLMRQFGVTSPTAPAYTGTPRPSVTLPGPTGEAPIANPNYNTQMSQFNADMAKYSDYLNQYNDRIATGSVYNAPQYNAGLPGTFTGVHSSGGTPLVAPTYGNYAAAPGGGNTANTGAVPGSFDSSNYNYLENLTGSQLPDHTKFQPGNKANLNGVTYVIGPDGNWQVFGPASDTLGTTNTNSNVNTNVSGNFNEDFSNIGGGSLNPGSNLNTNPYINQNTNTNPYVNPYVNPNTNQNTDQYTNPYINQNTDPYAYNPANVYDKTNSSDVLISNYSPIGFKDFTKNQNEQEFSSGGAVKRFAVGGLNDMAEEYGISMLPGNQDYQYGPRPKEGPLGSWFEEVAKEIVPGVGVSGRARTPERNREVGGVPGSYHLTDNARDFTPPEGMSVGELGNRLKKELGPGYDVIFNTKGHYDHVHVEPGPGGGSVAPAAASTPAATELGNITPPPAEGAPGGRFAELQMLLDQNAGDTMYAEELKAARAKSAEEADAFRTMLESSLASPEDAKASKAEMYFRLAAAFGSPTKTGGFGENLALASKEMADYSKGQRESAQGKLATRLKLQEMRMGAAKEDLSTLRALSAEEMKDKRALSQAMIKDYIESGKPQSAAGKQALDEGYKPGTPEYQARVREVAAMDVARETAQIQALVGNLKIAERREEREERKGEKLTPQEVTMKRDTEDSLASLDSAMNLIGQAYSLNPNTFDNSLVDQGHRKALELAGAKDPKLLNTRTLENLLKSQMITSAAEKMKGVLSDSDIALLKDIQGLDAKSVEERANILRTAYTVLKRGRERLQQRLKDVSSGAYREVSGD